MSNDSLPVAAIAFPTVPAEEVKNDVTFVTESSHGIPDTVSVRTPGVLIVKDSTKLA